VQNFDLDRQLGQERRLVLWCEAAGMLAQLERVASPFGVHAISGGGFDSVSDKWLFAQLVRQAGGLVEVLHVGDLDTYGESIFEVLAEDVQAFDDYRNVTFTRIAVTEAQVDEYDLPTAVEELVVQAEALPPDVLADIVETAIRERLDLDLLREVAERSAAIRADYESRLRGLWEPRP
jgi:hypothetical protein